MTARTIAFPLAAKALVAVLFAALFFFGLQPPAAHAAGEVDLTVKLTTKAGTSLNGVTVYAYPWESNGAKPYAPVVVSNPAGTGTYSLLGLDAGQLYALYFDAPSSATTAFDQFYGGTTWIEEADTLSWSGDATLSVSLATNSTITGTVKGTSGALAGVTVYPIRFDGSAWYELYGKRTTTSSTGAYTIRNLEPGSYKVAFLPDNTSGYLPEYSGNAPLEDDATSYYVGLGASAKSDATLAKGGAISGKVSLGTYAPTGIVAFAYPWTGSAIDTSAVYLSKATTSTGRWTVPGLPAGTYVVKLYDSYSPPAFLPRWTGSGGVSTAAAAAKYVVVGTGTVQEAVTTPLVFDDAESNLTINFTHDAAPIDGSNATLLIESANGQDYFAYVTPQDTADGYGFESGPNTGTVILPNVRPGDYTVTIDPGDPDIAPSTTTINKGNGNATRNIALADASAFDWISPPTLSVGGTEFGAPWTVTPATTSLDPVDYSYIWLRDGKPIYGWTDDQYEVRPVDVGHQISVLVRAEKFGYAPRIEVLDGPAIPLAPAPTNLIEPSIQGPAFPTPGQTLTANAGTWDVDDLDFLFEWKNGSTVLDTGRTFKVPTTAVNKSIYLAVTPSSVGYAQADTAPSSNSVIVGALGAPALKTSPTVTKSTSGAVTKYTVSKGTWAPTPTSFTYEWYLDQDPVGTGSVFSCTAASCPAAKALSVEVTVSYPGSADGIKRVLARKASGYAPTSGLAGFVNNQTSGEMGLDSSTPVDAFHNLYVTPAVYSYVDNPGATTYAYQWQRSNGASWTNVGTGVNYSPTITDIGNNLRVLVKVTSANYGTYSDPIPIPAGLVQANELLLESTLPSVQIASTSYYAGLRISASLVGAWPVSGVTYELDWYECDATTKPCDVDNFNSDWVEVATGPIYTTDADHAGWRVTAGVKNASKAGYAPVSYRGGSFDLNTPGVGAPLDIVPTKIVSGLVGGKAVIGKKLTAVNAVWDNPATVITSSWEYCPVAADCLDGGYYDTDWEPVPSDGGALTYTPTPDLIDLSNGYIRYTEFGQLDTAFNPASTAPVQLQPLALTQTKAASISKVGTNWVAKPGTWTSGTQFAYEWYQDGTPIGSSATQPVETTGPVYVLITASKQGYVDVVKRVVALKGNATFTAMPIAPTIYGDAPLHVDGDQFVFGTVPPEASYKYQWYSGTTAISGKTSATFVPSSSYVGKTLKVKVTMTSPLYNTVSKYSQSVVLQPHPADPVTATLTVSTDYVPGATMSVDKTGFPSGTTYSYEWQRSANGTTGWTKVSTASTYKLTANDPTWFFRAVIVGKKSGWVTPPATTSNVIEVLYSPQIDVLTTPRLVASGGAPRVGAQLSVQTEFTTTDVALSYEWYRNGIQIPGVTGPTWTPLGGSLGDEVSVILHASKAGYESQTFASSKVRLGLGSEPTASTKPALSGMTGSGTPKAPKVGNTLTATTGVWTVDGLDFSYQWQLDGEDIPAATNPTYLVTGGDTGGLLTVEVTAHRDGWTDGVTTSLPSKAVQP